MQGSKVRVFKWGDSLAVFLPAPVVAALDLNEGDHVEVCAASGDAGKSPVARELLARLRKHRGRLPNNFNLDRWEAYERR
jgi:antitoxin MazE